MKRALVILLAACLFLFAGCSSEPTESPSVVTPDPSPQPQAPVEPAPALAPEVQTPPAEPLDLTGNWRQVDAVETETYQFATIADGVLDIYWFIPDTGVMLHWAGTYDAPTDPAETYSWESANDTTRTASALMASGDAAKTISYENGKLSYTAAAFGMETTIQLERYAGELPDSAAVAGPQEMEGTLGNYDVKINGYRLAKDYENKDVLILQYTFTNNSEEAAAAMWSIYPKAFQDGIELETAFMMDDTYLGGNGDKELKPGISIDCESAYSLPNLVSPVEIEVTELISFDDAMVTATFQIAE